MHTRAQRTTCSQGQQAGTWRRGTDEEEGTRPWSAVSLTEPKSRLPSIKLPPEKPSLPRGHGTRSAELLGYDKKHAAWSLSSYLRLMWARGPPWKTLSLTVVFDDSA